MPLVLTRMTWGTTSRSLLLARQYYLWQRNDQWESYRHRARGSGPKADGYENEGNSGRKHNRRNRSMTGTHDTQRTHLKARTTAFLSIHLVLLCGSEAQALRPALIIASLLLMPSSSSTLAHASAKKSRTAWGGLCELSTPFCMGSPQVTHVANIRTTLPEHELYIPRALLARHSRDGASPLTTKHRVTRPT